MKDKELIKKIKEWLSDNIIKDKQGDNNADR